MPTNLSERKEQVKETLQNVETLRELKIQRNKTKETIQRLERDVGYGYTEEMRCNYLTSSRYSQLIEEQRQLRIIELAIWRILENL